MTAQQATQGEPAPSEYAMALQCFLGVMGAARFETADIAE
jgi:hypothetical protein